LQKSKIHQKIERSLKATKKKILELQHKIVEMNKHSAKMKETVEDSKGLIEVKKQRMQEV
jgi:hypothetical protein